MTGLPPQLHPDALLETARRLIGALQQEASIELRLALAKRVIRQLGEDAYPVFLKILLIVAESEDAAAKQTLADLLAAAAQRMDLPSGQLSAWGGSGQREPPAPHSLSRRRLLGPIEYLTVWYCQQTQQPMLEETLYADAIRKLVALFDHNTQLRTLYAGKLLADAGDELEGTYSCETRSILARLARCWQQAGSTPEAVASAALRGEAPSEPVPPGWIVHRL